MTTRRYGLGLAALLIAALAARPVASGAAPPGPIDDSPMPNVLVVVTDDQWAPDSMKVMPSTREFFGEGGTRFTNAYATTPLCCPARASIFTGRYAHNHGVEHNDEAEFIDQSTTLQRYLHDAGYATALAGKYFNDWPVTIDPPYFDRWSVFKGGYYNSVFNDDGDLQFIPKYSTSYVGDQAAAFLHDFEDDDAQPWFLHVATSAPHEPFTPARRYRGAPVPNLRANPALYEKDLTDKPQFVQDARVDLERVRERRRHQLRTLMSVDDMVGTLATELEDLGESDDTLAFFISDNGYLQGQHGLLRKKLPYTQSVQVPLFARWPSHILAGATDERIVANIDIAPTAMTAAGLSPDLQRPMDGRPLIGTSARPRLLLENWGSPRRFPTWASTRTAAYQYTEYYAGDQSTVTFREYYDLQNDPWELENLLADDDPSNDPDVAALSRSLSLDRSCSGATCP
jgi:arylsulfatase A-like enzyme